MIGGEASIMGKGDKRTKRGKLFKGTFGKRRVRAEKKVEKKGKEGRSAHG